MIRYIFSANPGRSGSGYLSVLLRHAHNVTSLHEPEPIMNRRPMIDFLDGHPQAMRQLMPAKLAKIKQSMTSPDAVYAEANHCFIKGFGWLLPEYIPEEQIGVIVLRRSSAAIAKSFYRIGVTAFNNEGRGWLIHANAGRRLVPLPNIPFLLPRYYYYRLLHRAYYFAKARPRLTFRVCEGRAEPRTPADLNLRLLCWYVDQVYALTEEYKRTFPRIRYYEVNTEGLNDLSRVLDMFAFFGLEPRDSLKNVVGVPVNTRAEMRSIA